VAEYTPEDIQRMSDDALNAIRNLEITADASERAQRKLNAVKAKGTATTEELNSAMSKAELAQRRHAEAEREAELTTRRFSKQIATTKQGLKSLGGEFLGVGKQFATGSTDITIFSDVIKTATNVVSELAGSIPVVGSYLESFGKGVGEAGAFLVERLGVTYDSFQKLSSVGATAGDGMENIVAGFERLQLPLAEYTALIGDNAELLASLGVTTHDSIEAITGASASFKTSEIGKQFRMLGYSAEDFTESMIEYSDMQRKMGQADMMDQYNLTQSTQKYLLELDAIAKITGMSRKEAENDMKSRMGDDRFRAMTAKMVANGQEDLARQMNATLTVLGKHDKDLATGLGHLMTGFASSEEATKVLVTLGSEAQTAAVAFKEGRISQEEFTNTIQKQAGAYTSSMGDLTEAVGTPQGFLDFSKMMDLSTEKYGKLGEAIDKVMVKQQEQMTALGGVTDSLNESKLNIEKSATALSSLTADSKLMADAVKIMTEAMEKATTWIKENVDADTKQEKYRKSLGNRRKYRGSQRKRANTQNINNNIANTQNITTEEIVNENPDVMKVTPNLQAPVETKTTTTPTLKPDKKQPSNVTEPTKPADKTIDNKQARYETESMNRQLTASLNTMTNYLRVQNSKMDELIRHNKNIANNTTV